MIIFCIKCEIERKRLLEKISYDSDLNATEHKIISYAASKMRENPSLFPNVEFAIHDFLEIIGLSSQSNYHL